MASERFRRLMSASERNWDASRAIVSMLRADSKAAQALERALAEIDLTLPQFNVLMVLAAAQPGSIPTSALTAELVSTPPNTTWLTNRMEERGLVSKRRDPEDGRVVLVELTERGWKVLAKAAPVVFAAEKELLRGFSRAELKTLGALLARFLSEI